MRKYYYLFFTFFYIFLIIVCIFDLFNGEYRLLLGASSVELAIFHLAKYDEVSKNEE